MSNEDSSNNSLDNGTQQKIDNSVESNSVSKDSQTIVNSDSKKTKSFISKLKPKSVYSSFKAMNRNTRLAVVLAVILLAVGLVAFALTRNDQSSLSNEIPVFESNDSESVVAKVSLKEGTLQIYKEGEWVDATIEQEVKTGDLFKTVGATSRAVIVFENGSEVRIDANSEIEIQSLTASRIEIKHNNGYTYNRVVESDGLTYIVVSEDAQYEALGTSFRTVATGDEQAVEVFESSIIETVINKTAKEGEKLIVKSEVNPSNNGKVEQLNIELIKNDAFLQWNRELDQKNDKFKNSLGFLGDLTAPDLTVNNTDGQTILLEPSATEGTIEFSGTTEKGASVTIQLRGGSTKVDAVVEANGNFKSPVIAAPIGTSTFEIVAKDRAGNTSTKNVRVTFQAKSQPVVTNGINLSGSNNNSAQKVELSWVMSGSTKAPDGVKIVYSKSPDPVLGNSAVESIYKETGSSESIKWSNLESGKTYYFKVCLYDKASSSCGLYSNQVTLAIP